MASYIIRPAQFWKFLEYWMKVQQPSFNAPSQLTIVNVAQDHRQSHKCILQLWRLMMPGTMAHGINDSWVFGLKQGPTADIFGCSDETTLVRIIQQLNARPVQSFTQTNSRHIGISGPWDLSKTLSTTRQIRWSRQRCSHPRKREVLAGCRNTSWVDRTIE